MSSVRGSLGPFMFSARAVRTGMTGPLGCVAGCQVSSKSIACTLIPFRKAAIAGVALTSFEPHITLLYDDDPGLASLTPPYVFAHCFIVWEISVRDPINPTPIVSRNILLLLWIVVFDKLSNEAFDIISANHDVTLTLGRFTAWPENPNTITV